MQKGYICSWKQDVAPNDNRNIYSFCQLGENAAYWPTRYVAEAECMNLNRGVTIPPGGIYVINNFQVEEAGPDRFLIFCEAPFEELKYSPFYRP
jgi:hypothetical protein